MLWGKRKTYPSSGVTAEAGVKGHSEGGEAGGEVGFEEPKGPGFSRKRERADECRQEQAGESVCLQSDPLSYNTGAQTAKKRNEQKIEKSRREGRRRRNVFVCVA